MARAKSGRGRRASKTSSFQPSLAVKLLKLSSAHLLGEQPPVPLELLPGRFDSIGEYTRALQTLVFEEARHTLAESARAALATHSGGAGRGRRTGGLVCDVIDADDDQDAHADAPRADAPPAAPSRAVFRFRTTSAELSKACRPGGAFLLLRKASAPPSAQAAWRVGIVDSASRDAVGCVSLLVAAQLPSGAFGREWAACVGSAWDAVPLDSLLACQRMWQACDWLPRLGHQFENELLGVPPATHTRFDDTDDSVDDADSGAGSDTDDSRAADLALDGDGAELEDEAAGEGARADADADMPDAGGDDDARAGAPEGSGRGGARGGGARGGGARGGRAARGDDNDDDDDADGEDAASCQAAVCEAARRTRAALNSSQRSAIDSLLAALDAEHAGESGTADAPHTAGPQATGLLTQPVAAEPGRTAPPRAGRLCLLQGPPGTGKTSTIVALLCALAARPASRGARRVLVCAPSNQAVSLLLDRFLKALTPTAAPPPAGAAEGAAEGAAGAWQPGLPGELLGWPLARIALVGVEERLVAAHAPPGAPRAAPAHAACAEAAAAEAAEAQAAGLVEGVRRCFVHTFGESLLAQLDAARRAHARAARLAAPELAASGAFAALARIRRRLRVSTPAFWKRRVSAPMRALRRALRARARARAHAAPTSPPAATGASGEPAGAPAELDDAVSAAWSALAAALALAAAAATDPSGESEAVVGELVFGARFLFCTLASAGRQAVREHCAGGARGARGRSELLIVDEAAQALEPELLIPLAACTPSRAWLVGDPLQLPATVLSPAAARAGLAVSPFERLALACGHPFSRLGAQYRMHAEIARWPGAAYYAPLGLPAAGAALRRREGWHGAAPLGPLSFIDVRSGREEVEPRSRSLLNRAEAAVAARLVRHLRDAWRLPVTVRAQCLLVTFYRAQVGALERALRDAGVPGVAVSTVDSVQGGESRVVIVSCVRAAAAAARGAQPPSIGFLRDHRRLNVALTRAQSSLIVLGHAPTLRAAAAHGGTRAGAAPRMPGIGELVVELSESGRIFAEAALDDALRASASAADAARAARVRAAPEPSRPQGAAEGAGADGDEDAEHMDADARAVAAEAATAVVLPPLPPDTSAGAGLDDELASRPPAEVRPRANPPLAHLSPPIAISKVRRVAGRPRPRSALVLLGLAGKQRCAKRLRCRDAVMRSSRGNWFERYVRRLASSS